MKEFSQGYSASKRKIQESVPVILYWSNDERKQSGAEREGEGREGWRGEKGEREGRHMVGLGIELPLIINIH